MVLGCVDAEDVVLPDTQHRLVPCNSELERRILFGNGVEDRLGSLRSDGIAAVRRRRRACRPADHGVIRRRRLSARPHGGRRVREPRDGRRARGRGLGRAPGAGLHHGRPQGHEGHLRARPEAFGRAVPGADGAVARYRILFALIKTRFIPRSKNPPEMAGFLFPEHRNYLYLLTCPYWTGEINNVFL